MTEEKQNVGHRHQTVVVEVGRTRGAQLKGFFAIRTVVVVGVDQQGIGSCREHFKTICQAIAVGVGPKGVGAHVVFQRVLQAVSIRVRQRGRSHSEIHHNGQMVRGGVGVVLNQPQGCEDIRWGRFGLQHKSMLLDNHGVTVQHKVQPSGRKIAVAIVAPSVRERLMSLARQRV